MRPSMLCSCLAESSAHGISHAARGTTPFQRAFWLVFFVLASAAFIYYCQENFSKYYSEPTSVTVQLFGTKFIPPDIHLCHINPLAKSRLLDAESLLNATDLQDDLKHLERILNSPEAAEAHITDDEKDGFLWRSISNAKLYSRLGHLHNQTFIISKMDTDGGKEFHTKDFEEVSSFYYFSCFRLSLENVSDFLSTANSLILYLYTDSYHLNATSLTFNNIPLSYYDYINSPSVMAPAGVMMIFTAPQRFPHVESHSVLLSPGRYTTVKLKMLKTVSARTSRNACKEHGETIDYHNPILGPTATTRYIEAFADCKYRKLLEKIMQHENCQCLPYMMPVSMAMKEKYPVCGDIFYGVKNNISLEKIKSQSKCEEIYYKHDAEFKSEECSREKPCTTYRYASDVSSTDWPLNSDVDNIVQRFLEPTLSDYKDAPGLTEYLRLIKTNSSLKNDLTKYNFAWATVSAGETRSQLIEESVIYGLENLISDTGGLAGLYLGMSFLTLMEVVNLIHDYVYKKIRKPRGDGTPSSKEMSPFIT